MTVITKPSLRYFGRKTPPQPDTSRILDVHKNEMNENEVQDREVETIPTKNSKYLTFSFVAAIAVMVGLAGLMCGLEIYRHSMLTNNLALLRYQGYCHIPLRHRERLIEPNYRMLPLDWHSIEADVQEFEPTETDSSDDSISDEDRKLIEEISISDNLENILVYNGPNGRPTSFIHDFAANISGIVDNKRCYVMNLNPEQVLPPQTMLLRIQGKEPFDLSHFRNTMRAILPPIMDMLRMSRAIAEKCADKPTYQLSRDVSIIRKRSAEPAKVEYKYFSGKQVQEIEIGNLNDLIAYEKANK